MPSYVRRSELIMFVLLFLLVVFPQIALWLPGP